MVGDIDFSCGSFLFTSSHFIFCQCCVRAILWINVASGQFYE